jgi:glycosyltransferase involved in cell wall biosynthesis
MQVPDGWTIVMNASKNTYSNEKYDINLAKTGGNLIELRKDFLTEGEMCLVFSSADAVILPYKVSSSSGVMFDALAYGLPFVATDLEFFKEFSDQQLGITVDRNPQAFSNALVSLDHEYEKYANVVERFGAKLSWKEVARRHLALYNGIVAERKQTVIS